MKKVNIKKLFFFIGYSLIIFSDMFSAVTKLENYVNYIDYLGLSVLLLVILLNLGKNKVNYKNFIQVFFLLVLLILVKISSNDNLLLKLIIIVLAFKDIEVNTFIKTDMIIRIIYMITVVTLFKLGLTNTYTMYRSDGLIRYSMGFSHPNNFGQYILIICCDYIYLNFNKIKLKNILVTILCLFLVANYSNSRTSTYCILLLSIMHIIYILFPKLYDRKLIKSILKNSFIVFAMAIIALVVGYKTGNQTCSKINDLLSGRLYYASAFLDKYSINLFGNEIIMLYTQEARLLGKQPWVLDNSYVVCLLRYGIIAFGIIYIVLRKIISDLFKKDKISLIIIWTVMSVNGMFENYLLKIHFNPYLIIFSLYLFDKYYKKSGRGK